MGSVFTHYINLTVAWNHKGYIKIDRTRIGCMQQQHYFLEKNNTSVKLSMAGEVCVYCELHEKMVQQLGTNQEKRNEADPGGYA